MQPTISKRLIVLLASVFAMTPFAIDSYLPAIPTIAGALEVNTAMISITVSIYVFGLAMGQLIGGPLSDRFGRMKIMVIGLVIFSGCSMMLAFSKHIYAFWAWRIIQSIGGGIAVVGVPATIRDNAEGKEAAKLLALIALISMIAPSVAPSVGTLIMNLISWHWIFIISGVLALIVALGAAKVLPNSNSRVNKAKAIGYRDVFTNSKAIGYLLSQGFSFAVLITFIANGAFVYMVHFEISAELFSSLFFFNILGLGIINRLNSFLLNRHAPAYLLPRFISLQVFGTSVLVLSQLFAPDFLWLTVAGFVISISANGGIMANSNASFLKHFGQGAGVASAALGASQFLIGASLSALAAVLSTNSLWPIVAIMFITSLLSLGSTLHANHKNREPSFLRRVQA
ncbi:multidrug effflux MFS transporter [Vibrio sp. WXL103]|uniref:multidrug effflux MFS transporter n=1 Tax=unclassified Vibrio TaxID=2614977 RepID=UPI003EC786D6